MSTLFHITLREEIVRAQVRGNYEPAGFAREGFIHCSYSHQVEATANRLFRGRSDLVLLEIDSKRAGARVVDESLEGGTELFPHIYGRLSLEAVVAVHDLPCNSEGRFTWPETKQKRPG